MSITRRTFLAQTSVSGATALMLDDLDAFAIAEKKTPPANGFEVMIFATNWGFAGSWDEFCGKIKALGYDSFRHGIRPIPRSVKRFCRPSKSTT